MKCEFHVNGETKLILSPESPVEEELLKDMCKTGALSFDTVGNNASVLGKPIPEKSIILSAKEGHPSGD